MIKAIIFDFDGLIIDTETPWYEAYKEVYSTYDVELPLEVWGKCVGASFDAFDPHDYLEEQLGEKVDRNKMIKATKERYAYWMKGKQIRDGVVSYLQDAKSKGLRIGIASSSNRKWVEFYLTEHGLIQFFDAIFTADDVNNIKPDPELYVKTMQSLHVQGNETIVFEDSLNGLKAAKAAGAYCVVVPNKVTAFMNFENEDLRLASMGDLSLQDVIEHVTA